VLRSPYSQRDPQTAGLDSERSDPFGVPTRPRHLRRRHSRTRAVINKARELIELARHHGYSADEVINLIDGVT
jgi:hypothetical protein